MQMTFDIQTSTAAGAKGLAGRPCTDSREGANPLHESVWTLATRRMR
jgi:hypothetical protein